MSDEVRITLRSYSPPPVAEVSGCAAALGFSDTTAPVLAVIDEGSWGAMRRHVLSYDPVEGLGFLFGEVLCDLESSTTVTIVRRAAPVPTRDAGAGYVTATPEEVGAAFHADEEQSGSDGTIGVGWFHSHPNMTIFRFLSPRDRNTIAHAFPHAHQLSLVWGGVDLSEIAVFANGPDEPTELGSEAWLVLPAEEIDAALGRTTRDVSPAEPREAPGAREQPPPGSVRPYDEPPSGNSDLDPPDAAQVDRAPTPDPSSMEGPWDDSTCR